jgi:hypothetical protein
MAAKTHTKPFPPMTPRPQTEPKDQMWLALTGLLNEAAVLVHIATQELLKKGNR